MARKYESEHRARQAAQTREMILAAARRLFAERGYARTSMAEIAREAGVALQTLYASVGGKPELVLGLVQFIEHAGGVREHARRIAESDDPQEVVRLAARLSRQLQERCGDIIAAIWDGAAFAEEVAAAKNAGNKRHLDGTTFVSAKLAELNALRAGVSTKHAADVLGLVTSFETYRQLTEIYDWSWEACERWVAATLAELLLAPSTDS
jgi:AcrR family transcriptional regulator